MSSSVAARAAQQIRKAVSKGKLLADAIEDALVVYPADKGLKGQEMFLRFKDAPRWPSYLHIYLGLDWDDRFSRVYVATNGSDKFSAMKVIDNIHAYCDQCGQEVWCDYDGEVREWDRFELPGRVATVCSPCQRDLVKRALIGE